MASTESGRGTKRSIDDVQSDDDALERNGKLLWDIMIKNKLVVGLVTFMSSSEGDKNGFFVIGSDPDKTLWKSSKPIWRNYADIWLATRLHPGETVETVDSRPTQKELSNRMAIFIEKARNQQEKHQISRIKGNHSCPTNGAIVVSGPTNKNHNVTKSEANLPTSSEHRRFDFFDGLAHAARKFSMQETNRLTAHIKYLSTTLEDTREALSEEKKSHCQDVEDIRKEIEKLTEEAEKKISDLSAAFDEEKEARRKAAKESDAVVQKLEAKLSEEQQEKKSLLKASEKATAKIQSLEAKVKEFSSKFEKERQDRHEAINSAVEESQQRMAKHHNKVMKETATRHKTKMQCLESENKKLKQEKEGLQTTVSRFMAVAKDVQP